MKKLTLALLITLLATTAYAVEVDMTSSNTDFIGINLTGEVACLLIQVDGLPLRDVQYIGTSEHSVDFNAANGKIVVYGSKYDNIPTGNVLTLYFNTPEIYGEYPVSIIYTDGASLEAKHVDVTVGGDGIINLLPFTQDREDGLVNYLLGFSTSGDDINGDGTTDIADLQLVTKYKG